MPVILNVVLDLTGWERDNDPNAKTATWQSVTSDQLRLTCAARPVEYPDLDDIATVRRFYKQLIAGRGGALISCDIVGNNNTPAVKTIYKYPAGSALAMSFGASLTAPVSQWMIELLITGSEGHFTGLREAVVLQEKMKTTTPSEQRQLAAHEMPLEWKFERYEPGTRGTWAYLISDDEKHDSAFTDHPLTRVRRWLRRAERSFAVTMLAIPATQQAQPVQVVF